MTNKPSEVSEQQLTETIVKGILEIKGENIVLMDLKGLDGAVTNHFIICEGNSTTQIGSIKDSVQKVVRKELKERPWHVEGTENLEWVLMDYVNVVVHIFNKEKRDFYSLEKLWADAKFTTIEEEN